MVIKRDFSEWKASIWLNTKFRVKLKVGCLPYAVGKQPHTSINLGKNGRWADDQWWWWWRWMLISLIYYYYYLIISKSYVKESMRLMGLKTWINWSAWLFKFGVFMLVSVAIMTLLFHIKTSNGAVINYTDPSVTFVFLFLYVISIIMFCFAISSFFSKGEVMLCSLLFEHLLLRIIFDSACRASKIIMPIQSYAIMVLIPCTRIPRMLRIYNATSL